MFILWKSRASCGKCWTKYSNYIFEKFSILLKESCSEKISASLQWVDSLAGRGNEQIESSKQTTFGLVIDGETLQYALTEPLDLEFLRLAKSCEVVVCCRAAPAQKVL